VGVRPCPFFFQPRRLVPGNTQPVPSSLVVFSSRPCYKLDVLPLCDCPTGPLHLYTCSIPARGHRRSYVLPLCPSCTLCFGTPHVACSSAGCPCPEAALAAFSVCFLNGTRRCGSTVIGPHGFLRDLPVRPEACN